MTIFECPDCGYVVDAVDFISCPGCGCRADSAYVEIGSKPGTAGSPPAGTKGRDTKKGKKEGPRPRVYVTFRMPSPGIDMIREHCDVVIHEGHGPPERKDLIENLRDKDGLVCIVNNRIDGPLLAEAVNLKVVSTYSVGLEHIDVGAATGRGVYLGYTPGVLTDATADLAFALLLAAARRITEAERYLRSSQWKAWSPDLLLGRDVWGATIGIVGMGRIGKAVAKRARGFGMRILYADVAPMSKGEEEILGAVHVPLNLLLKESDYVTIHTPLREETRHLMNEERFQLMKPSAIFINTSRGGTVDEAALVRAVKEGWIAGAALDVYDKEPIEPDNPLLGLDNVVLVPHVGSATRETRARMSEIAAQNLLAVFSGVPPVSWVNPEVEKIRSLSDVRML